MTALSIVVVKFFMQNEFVQNEQYREFSLVLWLNLNLARLRCVLCCAQRGGARGRIAFHACTLNGPRINSGLGTYLINHTVEHAAQFSIPCDSDSHQRKTNYASRIELQPTAPHYSAQPKYTQFGSKNQMVLIRVGVSAGVNIKYI